MTTALIAFIINVEIALGIPAGLLTAVCTVESNLNPYAHVEMDGKGGRSSYGMCQVQLRTAEQFRSGVSREELYNPVTNAYVSGAYLKWQYQRYGNWERAVVAYNRGSSNGGVSEYARKVFEVYVGYKKHQGKADLTDQGRSTDAGGGICFLREDLAYAD